METNLKAPAKINLCLNVKGTLPDGYHNLRMIMRSICLYDVMNVKINSENDSDKYDIELSCNKPYIPTDENNLIYKIVKYIYDKYDIKDSIKIKLTKNIPTSAGLGGGSSDAASILVFLNKHYKLNLSTEELINVASKFGSDIPFFIYKKECLCEGKGEKITPISTFNGFYIVLVTPNKNVSTKEIFDEYTKRNCKPLPDADIRIANVIEAIKNKKFYNMVSNMFNDLEQVTENMYPEIKFIKELLLENGAKASLMSGSGPSVFGMFNNYFTALSCKNKIKGLFHKYFVYVSRPI